MPTDELDEVDFGILHLLQEDARHISTVEMAEHLSVSDQTIRNRIENLEEQGIIEGYYPKINYEKAGFQLRIRFTCTAPVDERKALAAEALQLQNVVRVEEILSSKENVRPLAVTDTAEEITDIASDLTDLGLTIESQHLVSDEKVRPFNHFGENIVSSR
ncbi:Lrp/AsnC family transcriptional regulator [Natrialbaceae archaeon GCM10025810]|uniref:Lrp/AsnC family transcriptional regulator n=1 Tax=Halovalidus salilacus TaxID=3075124 RepID=UPI0036062621